MHTQQHYSGHHPPHPPPNYCCQLAPRQQTSGVITIFPIKPHSYPKVDRFWDPVRQDAATRPPTPAPPPLVIKTTFDNSIPPTPFVVALSDSEPESPTSVISIDEPIDTGETEAREKPARPKRIRRRRSRNYACTFCPSAFERPSSLQQHIRRHTGEKPFKCPSCTKSFSIASNARRHSKSCKGTSPHFEFTSMPSPPSTPPYRSLRLEISDDVHGKGRPWEVCADEPSHRLYTLEGAEREQEQEQDDDVEDERLRAKNSHSDATSVRPTLADKVARRNTLRRATSPVDSGVAGIRSPFSDSVPLHEYEETVEDASSPLNLSPSTPSSAMPSSSSAPFDWRVGRACRGATGTRYRIHQRVEPPTPVAVLAPIDVDVELGVKAESEPEANDYYPQFPLSPVSLVSSTSEPSSLFSSKSKQNQSQNVPNTGAIRSRSRSHSIAAPPLLLRPRSSRLHKSLLSTTPSSFEEPIDRTLPSIFNNNPFKAPSPYAPFGLSSPFYPSSRRWSIDSGTSSVSTASTSTSTAIPSSSRTEVGAMVSTTRSRSFRYS